MNDASENTPSTTSRRSGKSATSRTASSSGRTAATVSAATIAKTCAPGGNPSDLRDLRVLRGEIPVAAICPVCPGALKFSDATDFERHLKRYHGEAFAERTCNKCKALYLVSTRNRSRWTLCPACDRKRRAKMGKRPGDRNRTHRAVREFNEGIPLIRKGRS